MSKKGSQTATSTTTSAPTPEAKALYDKILQQAQGVAATPYTAYGGELTAGLTPEQQLAVGNINAQAGSAQPSIQQALQMAQQAAQPLTVEQIQQYVNPYTQNVVAATQAQFANQNAQQRQGVLGNAIAQGALGGNREAVAQAELANQQQLAQAPVIANLMSQGYGQGVSTALAEQQARMAGAQNLGNLGIAGQQAGLAGAGAQLGAGTLGQQTQQAADLAAYQQFQNQQAYPFQTLQWLAGLGTGVGSQLGGTTTGTQTQPQPSPLSGLLGGAGTLFSGLGQLGIFSDKKVKENIKRIGKTNDGQNIYLYNYKGDPTPRVGLLAQEVEKVHPEAVSEINGIKAVDYEEALKHAVRRARGGAIDRADGGQIWGPAPQSMVAGEPWERAVGIAPKISITHGRGAPAPMSMHAPAQTGPQDFSKIAKQLGSLAGSVYDKIKSNPASKFADTPDAPPTGVAPATAAPTSLAPPPQGVAPVVTDRLPPTGQFASLEPGLSSDNAIFYRGGRVHGYALGGSPEDADIDSDNVPVVPEMPQGVAPTADKELSVASVEPEAKEMAAPALEPQGVAPSPSLKDVSRAGYAGIDTGPVSISDLKTGEEPEEAAITPSGVAPKPTAAVPKGAVPPAGGLPPQDLTARVQSFDLERAYDRRIPASIRTNNPGAMWSGPSSRKFGAVAHDTIGGGNDIAIFPAFEMGAAAHMDLLANKYSGMPLNTAIRKWSGGNYSAEYAQEVSRATGIPLNARLTPDLLNSPAIVPLAKAMAQHEAGRGGTAAPEQWQTAYKMFRAGTPNIEGFDIASASQPSAGVAPRGRAGVRVASADTGVASDALPPEAGPLTRGRSQGVAGPEPEAGTEERRPGFLSNVDLSAQSKLWPALMSGSLALMASRAPTLGQAIGEGGLTGLQTYAAEKEAQQAQAFNREKMERDERRLDISEQRALAYQDKIENAGAPKAPAGYRFNEKGEQEFIPGGPADPAVLKTKADIAAKTAAARGTGKVQIVGRDDLGQPVYGTRNSAGVLVSPTTGQPIDQSKIVPGTVEGTPGQVAATPQFEGDKGAQVSGQVSVGPKLTYDAKGQPKSDPQSYAKILSAQEQTPTGQKQQYDDWTKLYGKNGADILKNIPTDRRGYVDKVLSGDLDPYKVRPPALQSRVISEATRIDPSFTPYLAATRARASQAFATGKQGDNLRSFNTAVEHMETLKHLAKELNNGNWTAFNEIKNRYSKQFGYPEITNFEDAARIVGQETVKSIVGSGGGVGEREAAEIQSGHGLQAILGQLNTRQELMVGQLKGLKKQYEDAGLKNFEGRLMPNARRIFEAAEGREAPVGGAAPAGGFPAVPALPPADQRKVGETYQTTKGPLTWTGKDFIRSSAQPAESPKAEQALSEARAAIAAGRSRDFIVKRLKEQGYDPSQL